MTQELFAIMDHDHTVSFDPSLDTGDTSIMAEPMWSVPWRLP